ncbi:uncharacterized protein LOC124279477 [Haliotis rubra]|uniref:uncharacterized protein LOC124279477 n=1 Tax=Haliotis rubra TaxID=36100 RepID=UPI001EE5AC2A|nr:uncharacterized protein LOC124279477 [Haliotis rubra]XP_046571264.1 uncharacterized protein LOC124279477 [Haliotis rubra]
MDSKDQNGGCKGPATSRKSRRKTTRKRPQSAPAVSKATSGGGDHPTGDRYHATSFPLFSGSSSLLQKEQIHQDKDLKHIRGDGKSKIFPFQMLPDYCKLKVFSFLSNIEKARMSVVCRSWSILMKTPRLWNHVLFSALPLGCLESAGHETTNQCYKCYKNRVFLFADYLLRLRPILHSFEFKLDIADAKVKYLQLIENVLHSSHCADLHYADINWKETPALPFWLESARWSQSDEVIQNHRHRQRLFVNFFNDFTHMAPNLQTLILPFDWSENSVEYLSRLKTLHSLVLEKYFVFQNLNQKLLTRLLENLPKLSRLMLEVWTPSGQGLLTYSLASKSVRYLDISQSRGFYVQKLKMPKLKNFRVARHPWNGPLVMAENVNLPCLYDVLVGGAPELETVNDHRLSEGWQDCLSSEFEDVLKTVCSCRRHKSGWALY